MFRSEKRVWIAPGEELWTYDWAVLGYEQTSCVWEELEITVCTKYNTWNILNNINAISYTFYAHTQEKQKGKGTGRCNFSNLTAWFEKQCNGMSAKSKTAHFCSKAKLEQLCSKQPTLQRYRTLYKPLIALYIPVDDFVGSR